jgi:hypothetical protein
LKQFKNRKQMTNLPPHLQERIEKEATKIAQSAVGTYQGFLAGASFLYALLKEEKGEVGVWRKVTDNRKAPDDWFGPIRYDRVSEWEYDVGFGHEVNEYDGNEPIEWLDTDTPVVAGCGELAAALKTAREALNNSYNVQYHPADGTSEQDTAIKAIDEALKQPLNDK